MKGSTGMPISVTMVHEFPPHYSKLPHFQIATIHWFEGVIWVLEYHKTELCILNSML